MAEGGKIPIKLGNFNTFIIRIVPFLADPANQARLGVSDDNKNDMVDKLGAAGVTGTWVYLWALTSSSTTATKPLRNSRDTLKKEMSTLVRKVYDDIPESALTDSDRTTLLIPKRDKKPSKRSKIKTRPTLKLLVQGGASFLVENRVDKDQTRPSKHPDCDYIELRYIIQPTPPASVNECNVTKILSKAREVLELDPSTAGQKIHCYSRWANKTDEAKSSNWTRVHSAVISD